LDEEGNPPVEIGLPHDVGTPKKLLDALRPLIDRGDTPGGIGSHANDIVSLIDKQLMKSSQSPQYIADELRDIKDQLINQYMPQLTKSRERRSSRRDQYRADAETSAGRDYYADESPYDTGY
jgi:hypothetical protein